LARSKSRGRAAAPDVAPDVARRLSIPWLAVALTLVLLVTAALAVNPIRDVVTHGPVDEMRLTAPVSYFVVAPLSTSFDTLTLLTVGQHIALILWAMLIFAGVRVWLAYRRPTRARNEVAAAGLLLLGIFATYAAALLLPRPMARLTSSDSNVLVVDFHSHTEYSHDGRPDWTEDDVRAWYGGAGFNAAYVTDHRTFEGAERAIASNSGQAGENVMLLQGIEAFYKGEHVNVLSAGRRYRGLLDATLKDVDPDALKLASIIPATTPTLIETLPGKLDVVRTIAESDTSAGVSAIEIIDGSPRGLTQTRRDRERIVHLADSLNLALVTGSDNHGWGHAAAGWTLLRIPGWRGMPADSLSSRIEQVLHVGRRAGTRVVERRVAGAGILQLIFAGPLIAWRMFTALSSDERVSWIIWVWALFGLSRVLKRVRSRPSATA
jgi:predicted metal-dependent phosphoesterase TrpH